MSSVTGALIGWILSTDARELDAPAFVTELGERLLSAGLPLLRMTTSLLTLHPEVFVRSLRWTRGQPIISRELPHDVSRSSDYVGSPVEAVHKGGAPIRVRLDGPPGALPHPQLRGLREAGATDYLIVPLTFRGGRRTYFSWAVDRPGGFTDQELGMLEALTPALSLRLELDSAYFATASLLRVYLGEQAAHRVLSGAFHRGSGEEIEAAILFCDMRGFTALSDALPMRAVIPLLDRYFECVAEPIAQSGGEVLKFIGDAVLAIFPVEADARDAAVRALGAAEEAVQRVGVLSGAQEAEAAGGPGLSAGIGLHLGRVTYGNVGAPSRLDFTVIGPAVNETSRIEALTKSLGEPIVLSAELASKLPPGRVRSLGRHALRGVREPKELFSPAPAAGDA